MRGHATFKMEDAFMITGRGLVLSGTIISGTIHLGNHIIIEDKLIEIKGVELMRKIPSSDNVGLLIGNRMSKDDLLKHRYKVLEIIDVIESRNEKLNDLGI